MKKFMCFLLVFFTFNSWAQESGGNEKQVITANLGFNMTRVKNLDESGFGLMLGGKYSYFFSPKVGAFIGLDYMQRNASENGLEFTSSAIDIPLGLTFRHTNFFETLSATFLGVYYTLPQGGELTQTGSSADTEGENHFGFLFHSESYFEVSPGFDLGFFGGLKFGFGDQISKVGNLDSTTENNTLDVSFGLAAKF